MRGQHDNRPHKIPPEAKETVRAHITRFPKYRSHCSRKKNPHKVYILLYIVSKVCILRMWTCVEKTVRNRCRNICTDTYLKQSSILGSNYRTQTHARFVTLTGYPDSLEL